MTGWNHGRFGRGVVPSRRRYGGTTAMIQLPYCEKKSTKNQLLSTHFDSKPTDYKCNLFDGKSLLAILQKQIFVFNLLGQE